MAHHWDPFLPWFWIIPLFFMILMFVFACRRFRPACSWRRGSEHRAGRRTFGCCRSADDPDLILDQRYARGEITKQQYEAMKHDLGSR